MLGNGKLNATRAMSAIYEVTDRKIKGLIDGINHLKNISHKNGTLYDIHVCVWVTGTRGKRILCPRVIRHISLIKTTILPPARPNEIFRKVKGWLTDIGHNLWWHIRCGQHAAHYTKFEKMKLFKHPWCWPKLVLSVSRSGQSFRSPCVSYEINKLLNKHRLAGDLRLKWRSCDITVIIYQRWTSNKILITYHYYSDS